MKFPVIINDSVDYKTPGDVSIYDSLQHIEQALEYDDIKDDFLFCLDSEGRQLDIIEKDSEHTATIVPIETHPSRRDDLETMLRAHWIRIGEDMRAYNDWSLDKLIQEIFVRDPNPYS